MVRHTVAALIPLFTLLHAAPAWCDQADTLYSAKAIVTGQGEKNREPGFRDCLTQVLVRVSGDQRLTARPEMADLLPRAGSFVQSFSYRDRLAGKPIHDEQGTYDRPHDLTCRYEPSVIDGLLADFGSDPWRDARPALAVFLDVTRYQQAFRVSRENPRDAAMRDSFALAASALAMTVVFPSAQDGDEASSGQNAVDLAEAASTAGADMPLIGKLDWSDADHGWVASWHLSEGGREHSWTVRGVNFDEAFRVAVRGAAQILSGNGTP
ncbi:MAG: DUF2066 domain-containing protein [Rhizobium sp.]|nr:DUF2066 domain-containing protein [Rhizobium sp.]PJI38227.1 MAG: hypothetical protein CTR54_21690 [Rhizobium sp.]